MKKLTLFQKWMLLAAFIFIGPVLIVPAMYMWAHVLLFIGLPVIVIALLACAVGGTAYIVGSIMAIIVVCDHYTEN